MSTSRFTIWRHPKPQGAHGRCIGRTDLPVDPRKAKRLAHRIRTEARRAGLPQAVVTSPLQRCAAVGKVLRMWGWRHRLDAQLLELDFGSWDGLRWDALGPELLDDWVANFANHAPGGGESLVALFERVRAWQPQAGEHCVVGHGGWMRARLWLAVHGERLPVAAEWTGVPGYGASVGL